ncbi:MAG: dethiobiotin synthase [Burkholderiales bacterium]
MNGLFVTGTDTGVGKTLVASALLHAFGRRGLRTVGMKPVAAGAMETGNEWRNDDVDALVAAGNVTAPRDEINPYAFAPAIAPHLAAIDAGVTIDIDTIAERFRSLAGRADMVVVEGAGGFLVPLNARHSFADVAVRLGLPVVLVVGMRLGCLNHALLSAAAIRARGLVLAGWVANRIDAAMLRYEDNRDTLVRLLEAPLIADIPWLAQADPARVVVDTRGLIDRPAAQRSGGPD